MGYLVALFIALTLYGDQITEIKITPQCQKVEINQEVNLKVEGIYCGEKIEINSVNWQSDRMGSWVYLSDKSNKVIYIPQAIGFHHIRAEWRGLKDYITLEVKEKNKE